MSEPEEEDPIRRAVDTLIEVMLKPKAGLDAADAAALSKAKTEAFASLLNIRKAEKQAEAVARASGTRGDVAPPRPTAVAAGPAGSPVSVGGADTDPPHSDVPPPASYDGPDDADADAAAVASAAELLRTLPGGHTAERQGGGGVVREHPNEWSPASPVGALHRSASVAAARIAPTSGPVRTPTAGPARTGDVQQPVVRLGSITALQHFPAKGTMPEMVRLEGTDGWGKPLRAEVRDKAALDQLERVIRGRSPRPEAPVKLRLSGVLVDKVDRQKRSHQVLEVQKVEIPAAQASHNATATGGATPADRSPRSPPPADASRGAPLARDLCRFTEIEWHEANPSRGEEAAAICRGTDSAGNQVSVRFLGEALAQMVELLDDARRFDASPEQPVHLDVSGNRVKVLATPSGDRFLVDASEVHAPEPHYVP